jgi:hypothetical protein
METPEGLHELQYARHILEEVLGWPAKGNLELIGDCIRSISLTKKATLRAAHVFLVKAITLAKEQEIPVDKFFFQDGRYMEIRPKSAPPEVLSGGCERCGGAWRLWQDDPRVPGPRLIPCPKCCAQTMAASA